MYTSNKRRRTADMLVPPGPAAAAAAAAPAPSQPAVTAAPPADGQSADPRDELRRLALEVEPVVLPRPAAGAGAGALSPGTSATDPGSGAPVIGYQPTYRAVLAKRGYLVRNTLGSGSYSKVHHYSIILLLSLIHI